MHWNGRPKNNTSSKCLMLKDLGALNIGTTVKKLNWAGCNDQLLTNHGGANFVLMNDKSSLLSERQVNLTHPHGPFDMSKKLKALKTLTIDDQQVRWNHGPIPFGISSFVVLWVLLALF